MHHMGTIWAPSMSLASASSTSDGHYTSKQDSKSDFWSLLRTPCLDSDGGQSAFSTSSRRSLFLSMTCIVMYSCLNRCLSSLVLFTCLLLLRYLCRLPGRWILFILICAWNATAVDCKICATKSACCLFPSPCTPTILRATLSGIFSGVDYDDFVTIFVERVTCLLKCSSLRLRVAPCIFSSLFCCSGFWWNPIIEKGFCVLAMVKTPLANCL